MFEFGVGFCDRVWAHDQFLRQGPNAGELLPLPESPTLDGMPDLLHQLQVKRLPRGGFYFEKHNRLTVMVSGYTNTANAASELLHAGMRDALAGGMFRIKRNGPHAEAHSHPRLIALFGDNDQTLRAIGGCRQVVRRSSLLGGAGRDGKHS